MNRKNRIFRILLSGIVFSWPFCSMHAEQVTQTISLAAGWNAVFLEVEPVDAEDPNALFASLSDNLISVWAWNPQMGTVEFTQNPTDPAELANDPHMLVYIPNEDPVIITNLHAIHGQ